jgi:hypothetical protein
MDDERPARPRPTIEPPQPPPGGPNAIGGVGGDGAATAGSHPIPRDLDPRLRAAWEEKVPDEIEEQIEEGEDTDTKATKGEAEPRPEEETPA